MKHTFRLDPKGAHIRLSDNARGTLREYADTVTIQPASAVVDPSGFTLYAEPPPAPAPLPHAPVPESVGRGQLFAAFVALGWFASDTAATAAIEAAIGTLPETQNGTPYRATVLALFRNATEFRLSNLLLPVVQQILGKTDAQRDELFRLAATF